MIPQGKIDDCCHAMRALDTQYCKAADVVCAILEAAAAWDREHIHRVNNDKKNVNGNLDKCVRSFVVGFVSGIGLAILMVEFVFL